MDQYVFWVQGKTFSSRVRRWSSFWSYYNNILHNKNIKIIYHVFCFVKKENVIVILEIQHTF